MSSVLSLDLDSVDRRVQRAVKQARKIELEFFAKNPQAVEFDRAAIDYEYGEPVPPGMRVRVTRTTIRGAKTLLRGFYIATGQPEAN